MEKCVFIEQFVQEVRSYSSQYGSDFSISYTAYNITGRPSKFPDYGDFPQTFVMRTYGRWWDEAPSRSEVYMPQTCGDIASQDYIELEFEQAVFPSRVHVYEIYNPGAVVRVWASDGDRWARLWEGGPQVVGHVPRIFSPDIARVHFPAKLLRLEFSHRHLDYYTEIDAVLLAGSKRAPARGGGSGGGCDQASVGSLASHILDLNIHSIPAQVDIPSSIEKFLANDLPQLLKEAEIATQLVAPVASEKPGCGFDLLPNEIIFKIFGYLDLKSLCRCCQVDKRFQNLACDYQLYTEVNLKVYWFCATGRTLSALAPRCRLLRKLDLSWCGSLRSVTADHFARAGCSELQRHHGFRLLFPVHLERSGTPGLVPHAHNRRATESHNYGFPLPEAHQLGFVQQDRQHGRGGAGAGRPLRGPGVGGRVEDVQPHPGRGACPRRLLPAAGGRPGLVPGGERPGRLPGGAGARLPAPPQAVSGRAEERRRPRPGAVRASLPGPGAGGPAGHAQHLLRPVPAVPVAAAPAASAGRELLRPDPGRGGGVLALLLPARQHQVQLPARGAVPSALPLVTRG
ncbi:F-box/LRR-repeat protein 4 isoform X3 [Bacillus rossius redtenbacheri]